MTSMRPELRRTLWVETTSAVSAATDMSTTRTVAPHASAITLTAAPAREHRAHHLGG